MFVWIVLVERAIFELYLAPEIESCHSQIPRDCIVVMRIPFERYACQLGEQQSALLQDGGGEIAYLVVPEVAVAAAES